MSASSEPFGRIGVATGAMRPLLFVGSLVLLSATDLVSQGWPAPPEYLGRHQGRVRLAKAKQPKLALAIERGLEWLKKAQNPDGSWPGGDVTVNSLAVLAFLGDGSTMKVGPYKAQVKNTTRWLIKLQDFKTGLIGRAGQADRRAQAIAALALGEIQGLSSSPILKRYAKRALQCVREQQRDGAEANEGRVDLSTRPWVVQALWTGNRFRVAAGDHRPDLTWLDKHTAKVTGQLRQAKGAKVALHTATAAGLWMRLFVDRPTEDVPVADKPLVQKTARHLLNLPPAWRKDGKVDLDYWYFATSAMRHMGPKTWAKWRACLRPVLAAQISAGAKRGSWNPVGKHSRVYTTAMLILVLESEYRFSRLGR